VHYYLGAVALEQGKVDDALVEFHGGLALWEKALGKDHPSLSAPLTGIGNAQLARGDARGALLSYQRSIALLEPAVGAEHPDLAEGLTGMGLANLKLAQARRALPVLERALEIQLANPGDPLGQARTEFALARALVGTGGDRVRAHALATHARAAYAANEGAKKETAELDAWLATNR
jgi:hypothetical protein